MMTTISKRRTFRLLPYQDECVFVNYIRNVDIIDQYDARSVFSSDSLSHMGGMAYDPDGKNLLVFNISGDAYLYSVPLQVKLFPKLKLNKTEGSGEATVSFFENWCFYIDKSGKLCRLDMKEGTVERVSGLEKKRIDKTVQIQDTLYLFRCDRQDENDCLQIEEYSVKNGMLFFQRCSQLEGISFIHDIKKDYDKKTPVLCIERSGRTVPELVLLDTVKLTLIPLGDRLQRGLLFGGFHTYLEKDLVAFACIDGAIVIRISSGKIEARYTKEDGICQCCDALFLNHTDIMFASWNGIYIVQPDDIYQDALCSALSEGDDWEKELLEGVKMFEQMLEDEHTR